MEDTSTTPPPTKSNYHKMLDYLHNKEKTANKYMAQQKIINPEMKSVQIGVSMLKCMAVGFAAGLFLFKRKTTGIALGFGYATGRNHMKIKQILPPWNKK